MPGTAAEPQEGDAFGRALMDRVGEICHPVVIERDDGYLDVDQSDYLAGWSERDTWALDRVRGRVLDVGAGAGRVSLALQDRGHDVVALDVSAGAIEVCRARGVRNVVHGGVENLAAFGTQAFDSVLMLGNNLGLLGSDDRAPGILRALGAVLRPGGVIIGTCIDPYQTDYDTHLAYHERNRERGRMGGQVTIRVRYGRLATNWFDLLWMSPAELAEIAGRAGWQVTEVRPGPTYCVALARA